MDRNRRIEIMGIVNVTDDSYYSCSRCADADEAVRRTASLLAEGADIIDIGACSTRPGASAVGVEVEWKRLEPVLRSIRREFPDVTISIDTWWSEIVRRAYDVAGYFIINDISAGEDDVNMLPLAGSLGLPYIAMHKRGDSMTMQSLTSYDDVTAEVISYFHEFARRAGQHSVKNWTLDPGFGFAKTIHQSLELLSCLSSLQSLKSAYGCRIMVGVSRKSMVYRFLDISPEESLAQTQVLHMKALQQGADILRVHDVAEAVRTVKMYRQLG